MRRGPVRRRGRLLRVHHRGVGRRYAEYTIETDGSTGRRRSRPRLRSTASTGTLLACDDAQSGQAPLRHLRTRSPPARRTTCGSSRTPARSARRARRRRRGQHRPSAISCDEGSTVAGNEARSSPPLAPARTGVGIRREPLGTYTGAYQVKFLNRGRRCRPPRPADCGYTPRAVPPRYTTLAGGPRLLRGGQAETAAARHLRPDACATRRGHGHGVQQRRPAPRPTATSSSTLTPRRGPLGDRRRRQAAIRA